jgi:hypothetical protein
MRVQRERQRPTAWQKEQLDNIIQTVIDVEPGRGLKTRVIPKTVAKEIYEIIKFPELWRLYTTGGNQAVIDRVYKALCDYRHTDYQLVASQLAPPPETSFQIGSDVEGAEQVEAASAPTSVAPSPPARTPDLEQTLRPGAAASSFQLRIISREQLRSVFRRGAEATAEADRVLQQLGGIHEPQEQLQVAEVQPTSPRFKTKFIESLSFIKKTWNMQMIL